MGMRDTIREVRSLLARLGFVKKGNASNVDEPCVYKQFEDQNIYFLCLAVGLVIPIVLSFFHRRKSFHREKCNGIPGLVIPINSLDMRHKRIGYLLAYGVLCSSIYDIFQKKIPFQLATDPNWAKKLLKVLAVVIYGTMWYPAFSAITAEMILGYAMAGVYVSALTGIKFYNEIACNNNFRTPSDIVILFFSEIQDYVFKTLLIIYFVVVIIKQCRGRDNPSLVAKEKEKSQMQTYVRDAFKYKFDETELKGKWMDLLQLKATTGFVFPPKFICSLLVSATVLYMLIISMATKVFLALNTIVSVIRKVEHGKESVMDFNIFGMMSSLKALLPAILYILNICRACLAVAMALAVLISAVNFPLVLRRYKRDVLLAYKGKFTYILPPTSVSVSSAVSGFSRLVGYQVAYLCWGFVIHFAVLSIIILIIGLAFFAVVLNGLGEIYLIVLRMIWLYILIGILIKISQILLIRFVFLEAPRNVIAINNRQVYFIWSYYMFFYDVFLGAVSCILRIIKSMGIGLFYVGRIDVCVLPPEFASMDPGYNAYCGFVLTEVAHTNPIMRTFVNILMDGIEAKRALAWGDISRPSVLPVDETSMKVVNSLPGFEENLTKKDPSLRSKQLQFQWSLIYTLHCNPSLRATRKHNLDKFKERMERLRERSEEEKEERKKLKKENKTKKRRFGAKSPGKVTPEQVELGSINPSTANGVGISHEYLSPSENVGT